MVIDIQEAYDLMEFLKKLKPEAGVHVAEQMVGKFKGIIPDLSCQAGFYPGDAKATITHASKHE
ncbi:MAG: hypothetical protein D4R88_09940 [Methanosarcinales archaeon]|nr:MAG: hypothetical protein D4R88_09940 [Methanosarcinales archaeon]